MDTKLPDISYKRYRLWIQLPHLYELPPKKKGDLYWSPVGTDSNTAEGALSWLNADFNIYKNYPNVKYKVEETIHWAPTKSTVKEGTR